jgi:SAM-dependent methyltransferase
MKSHKAARPGTGDWDDVGRRTHAILNPGVASYKRLQHELLLGEWLGGRRFGAALKTDSFEEAFGGDSFMPWLSSRAAVAAIDVSGVICRRARSNRPEAAYAAASVDALPFSDGCFDLVVSNSTLDHLPADRVPEALGEIARVMRGGGLLAITLDNAHNPLYKLGYAASNLFGLSPYHQERCYSKDDVMPMLAEAGFQVEEVRSIVHLPTPFNLVARALSPPGSLLTAAIRFFDKFGRGGRNIRTGWFLAFKCVKK